MSQTFKKKDILHEIENALDAVDGYGSVDIIVQDGKVTQISIKNIKKTSLNLSSSQTIKEERRTISGKITQN